MSQAGMFYIKTGGRDFVFRSAFQNSRRFLCYLANHNRRHERRQQCFIS